ncbi:MAG: hypothetical protein SOW30_01625, partial [Parabacteroides sp.]|nr:hypothetical protein [Parabacteroides sp.]
TDFMYEPSTGSIIIRNVTEELIIQATAESLTMYSIETELHDMDIEGLPEGDVIQEGQTLRFTLTVHNNYRLPATIQVKSSGEALSTDAYTYDTNTGVVEIPSVQGDITIIASAISEGFHEVVLQLTNLTSDLVTTSFTNGSEVNFLLRPHAGYTLPASLTVTLNGTTLTAGDQYVYDPSTGSFTLSSITGTLSITGVADPKDYGEAIFELTHITVGDGHTEKAIHGTIYECQLTADEGYELPNSLQVEMSGVLLNSGYTYENGLLRILSVTGPITITATATIRTYAVFSELENMTSDLTPDLMIAHGDPLTVHLSAAEGYSLPRTVSVQINGTDLTEGEGYTYADGVLTIASVTGPVNISASAILSIEVTETEKVLQGSIQAVHVETEGDATLSLNTLETDQLEISSNSKATLSVTADSKIQSLDNAGTLGLTSEGDATLEVQSIYNSGIMELQEGLKLTSTPQLVINDGTFVDNTGMIQKVNGLVVLEIHSPLPPTASCTKGLPFTLTVKVLVASGREKTIFEWQQKANDSWVTVHTDSQEGSLLRSDGLDELTSNYSFNPTESGIYRCIITNSKSEEMKTTLTTEISVTVNTPTPDPDPEPDPVPDPDPIPVPDPDPDPVPVPDPNPDPVKLYRVTLPLVEGTAVETYGSTYVRKGKSFSFRINIADGYNAKDMVVKANGKVLLPDATGLYVIEDIQDDVVVTITGIVKESPSAIEGPGYTMTSVWTGQGQIHIQLGKDATVTLSDYTGRIVNTFKGKVGDYHISIQKGSYVVSVDGLTYKVIL